MTKESLNVIAELPGRNDHNVLMAGAHLDSVEEGPGINVDAVAFAVMTFGYSTESVNGVPGKKVPGNTRLPAPAGPEGTF